MGSLVHLSPEIYRTKPSIIKQEVVASGDGEAGVENVFEQKTVALTFDDGPHSVYTKQLLDGLKERDVQATFFLVGSRIDGKEDIVKQMKEDGHLIGNHTQTHIQLTGKNIESVQNEINQTNQKIYEITGYMPCYIRPPFGTWSNILEEEIPMTVVLWNLDPLDWESHNTNKIANYIIKNAEDGSVILLHDIYGASVNAALEVIDTLSLQGYNFVTVDELLID